MKLGDEFFRKIKETFFTLVKDMLFDEIRIVLSTLEEDAGVIGAAALLLENHE